MAEGEKKHGLFSSLTYTNILLTIIVIFLVLGAVCKHMNKARHCFACKQDACKIHSMQK